MWWPQPINTDHTRGRKERDMLWLEIEGRDTHFIDITKLDSLRVVYQHTANYKIVGTMGDRDLCIKSGLGNASEARDFLIGLVSKIMT